MGVGLHGERHLRMPQQIADIPRADSLSQQERGSAVAQIVEPDARQAGRLQDRMKAADYASGVYRRANGGRKDEASFLAAPASGPFLLLLPCSMGYQDRSCPGRKVHGMGLFLFGRSDGQLAVDALDRLPNGQRAVLPFQVYIR